MALKEVRGQVKQQIIGYITAALGLVAGLAWNEAVKDTITYFLPNGQNSLFAKYLYAIVVTVFIVLLTMYILRLFREEEEK